MRNLLPLVLGVLLAACTHDDPIPALPGRWRLDTVTTTFWHGYDRVADTTKTVSPRWLRVTDRNWNWGNAHGDTLLATYDRSENGVGNYIAVTRPDSVIEQYEMTELRSHRLGLTSSLTWNTDSGWVRTVTVHQFSR